MCLLVGVFRTIQLFKIQWGDGGGKTVPSVSSSSVVIQKSFVKQFRYQRPPPTKNEGYKNGARLGYILPCQLCQLVPALTLTLNTFTC